MDKVGIYLPVGRLKIKTARIPVHQMLRAPRPYVNTMFQSVLSRRPDCSVSWHVCCRRAFSIASKYGYPPEARTPNLAPRSKDRGPASKEDTQTDFGILNVLGNTPPPATAVDACLSDGFHLSNGVKVTGGSGCLLLGGEVFSWRPWDASVSSHILNSKRQLEIPESAWGLLDLMWPKPELLILGMGLSLHPVSSETRKRINDLGIRLDALDTRNASAQFNLLATERGISTVAAALLPLGLKL